MHISFQGLVWVPQMNYLKVQLGFSVSLQLRLICIDCHPITVERNLTLVLLLAVFVICDFKPFFASHSGPRGLHSISTELFARRSFFFSSNFYWLIWLWKIFICCSRLSIYSWERVWEHSWNHVVRSRLCQSVGTSAAHRSWTPLPDLARETSRCGFEFGRHCFTEAPRA